MTNRYALAVFIAMVLLPNATLPLAAQPVRSCLCLAHPVTGALVYDRCEKIVPPNAYTPVVTCRSPKGAGSVVVPDWAAYKTVADGTPPCNPCDPPLSKSVGDVPRDGGAR